MEGLAQQAAARRAIYGLLARVLLREPDAALIDALRRPEVLPPLEDAGLPLLEGRWAHRPTDEIIHELSVDFAQLFLGPGRHVHPNESPHRDPEGTLWGEPAVEIQALVRGLGLSYEAQWTGGPDHLGVELELMERLVAREWEAWRQKDPATAARCLGMEVEFLEKHLCAWIPGLCDQVAAHARTGFYRNMARATRAFLAADREEVARLRRRYAETSQEGE